MMILNVFKALPASFSSFLVTDFSFLLLLWTSSRGTDDDDDHDDDLRKRDVCLLLF